MLLKVETKRRAMPLSTQPFVEFRIFLLGLDYGHNVNPNTRYAF